MVAEKPTRRRPTRSGTKASSMREWKSAEERGEREARRRRHDREEKASFHCDLFATDHLRPLRTSLMCTTPSTPFRARHPRRRPMSSETETSPTKGLLRVPPQRGRWLGRSKRTLCYILFRDTNTVDSKPKSPKRPLPTPPPPTPRRRNLGVPACDAIDEFHVSCCTPEIVPFSRVCASIIVVFG